MDGRRMFRTGFVEVCTFATDGPNTGRGRPLRGTRESLQAYKIPDWFRDAKFGIWAHWGPQSAIEQGDWYARNMYVQTSRNTCTTARPTAILPRVGYKDLVNLWKAEKWDPDHLMGLYKRLARSISSAWACITTTSTCGIPNTRAGTR